MAPWGSPATPSASARSTMRARPAPDPGSCSPRPCGPSWRPAGCRAGWTSPRWARTSRTPTCRAPPPWSRASASSGRARSSVTATARSRASSAGLRPPSRPTPVPAPATATTTRRSCAAACAPPWRRRWPGACPRARRWGRRSRVEWTPASWWPWRAACTTSPSTPTRSTLAPRTPTSCAGASSWPSTVAPGTRSWSSPPRRSCSTSTPPWRC